MELDTLRSVAAQLVGRVHDDDPDRNGVWLGCMLPDPADWWRLCFVLAAHVPTDRSMTELAAWVDEDTTENIERRRLVLDNGLKGGRGRR